jgi:hypothetical protein
MPIYLPLRPGIYREPGTGDIYRVRLNRKRNGVYTERWTAETYEGSIAYRFVYEATALARLRAEDRMALDEARAISRQAGQCLACAALLSDPASQRDGVGATCAKRWERTDLEGSFVFGLTQEEVAAARERDALASVRARVVGASIEIVADYNHRIAGIIRTTPGARWDGFAWYVPQSEALALAEVFALVGIAHDDIAAIAMGWDVAS